MHSDLLQPQKTACVTGHRPDKLGGYSLQASCIAEIRSWMQKKIAAALLKNYSIFISGMAQGIDQLFVEELIKCQSTVNDIRIVAAIPFQGQQKKWPFAAQNHYIQLLGAIQHIVYVSDGGYSSWKMHKRNEWMVDHSSLVLAVWDGSDGGAANCVHYAEKKQVEIWRYEL